MRLALTAALMFLAAAVALFAACGGDDGDGSANGLIVYEAHDQANVANIFTIDPESGETVQITHGNSFDGHPAWSRDRTRIIFASDREQKGVREVYTMAADGSDVRRITEPDGDDKWSPKYSPDGTQISYTLRRGSEYYMALMDADGSNVHTIAGPYNFAEFPAWTLDGDEIYFAAIGEGTQAADILAINLASGEVRTIISTPSADVCPHFTRDGKYLTYASSPHGQENADPDLFEHDLSSADTSGAADVPLTDNPARDDYSNPSPDGRHFVFISHRDGNADLYLMDRDGSNQRRLTPTDTIHENVPDW